MTDKQTVTEYRDLVRELSSVRYQIEWNSRHCLPVLSLAGQIEPLRNELIRFDVIMSEIPDIQIRNVLRLRYALGLVLGDIAVIMDTSKASVIRLHRRGMDMIEHRTGGQLRQNLSK